MNAERTLDTSSSCRHQPSDWKLCGCRGATLLVRSALWSGVDHAVRLVLAAVDSLLCGAHLSILQRPAVGAAAVGVFALLLLLLLLLLLKKRGVR
jgi:hypothetical protein